MNEEILYNQLYERTKEFGRTQFIKEIMRLERENKQLQQERDKYKSDAEKLEKIILELYEENKGLLNHFAIDKIKELEEGNSNGNNN